MTRLTQMHGQAGGYACQICNGKHPDVLATSCLITIVVSSHDGDIDGHDDIMRAADVLTRLQAHSHRGQSAAGPAGVKACDLHPLVNAAVPVVDVGRGCHDLGHICAE